MNGPCLRQPLGRCPCSPQFLQYDRGRDDSELLVGSVTLQSLSGFDRVLRRVLIVGCGVSN